MVLTEENLQDIFEVADVLSGGERELFIKLKEMVFAVEPNEILDYFEEILSASQFDLFLDRIDRSEKDNLWLIVLTLLSHRRFLFSYVDEMSLSEFICKFDELKQVQIAGILLKLDGIGLVEEAGIKEWITVLDRKFESEGFCLGGIAFQENQRYLFFNTREQINHIKVLAQDLGYKLDFAREIFC